MTIPHTNKGWFFNLFYKLFKKKIKWLFCFFCFYIHTFQSLPWLAATFSRAKLWATVKWQQKRFYSSFVLAKFSALDLLIQTLCDSHARTRKVRDAAACCQACSARTDWQVPHRAYIVQNESIFGQILILASTPSRL